MVLKHENMIIKDGYFRLGGDMHAKANPVLDKKVLKEFWNGYTFSCSEISFEHTEALTFGIGALKDAELDGYSYYINVEKDGIFIKAKDEKSLINGFVTMLDCISLDDEGNLQIRCCEIYEKPVIENRMIHFCVFPDTELWELERFVRLCGALKYSHIVIEFWGMLKYDCLSELSWSHGFDKKLIKPIIRQAKDLGMEVIPMFNHWGHASQSRVCHGKHVVLNQNPKLGYLFGEDGWCWNIKNKASRDLLRNIRNELVELCGSGEYFHIGCDEAYGFKYSEEEINEITEYINEIATELEKCGRKTIMWADMLLYKDESFNKANNYYAFAPTKEAAAHMTGKLNKSIIAADWQYECYEFPVETSLSLKNSGFNTLLCPWSVKYYNVEACAKTVRENDLFGIMHTTWHTLKSGTPYIYKVAEECWGTHENEAWSSYAVKTAEVLRKVYPTGGDYKKSGWSCREIE